MESEVFKFICANSGGLTIEDLVNVGSTDLSQAISNRERFVLWGGGRDGQPVMVVARTQLRMCRVPSCPGTCQGLHLCKSVLFGGPCPFSNRRRGCNFSHELENEHNESILRMHQVENLSLAELRTLLLQNDNALLPPICYDYNNADGEFGRCQSGDGCERLHVCQRHLRGSCGCDKNHGFNSPQPLRTLLAKDVPEDLILSLKSVYRNKMTLWQAERAASHPQRRGGDLAAPGHYWPPMGWPTGSGGGVVFRGNRGNRRNRGFRGGGGTRGNRGNRGRGGGQRCISTDDLDNLDLYTEDGLGEDSGQPSGQPSGQHCGDNGGQRQRHNPHFNPGPAAYRGRGGYRGNRGSAGHRGSRGGLRQQQRSSSVSDLLFQQEAGVTHNAFGSSEDGAEGEEAKERSDGQDKNQLNPYSNFLSAGNNINYSVSDGNPYMAYISQWSAPEKPSPAPDKPSPAPDKPSPAPDKPSPAPEKPSPAPAKPAPAPAKPAPLPAPDKTEICLPYIKGSCKNGEKCDQAHVKMPYRWEVREGGEWIALPDNEAIEKAYCRPEDLVSRTTRPVCFHTMTCGLNKVRRLSTCSSVYRPPDILSTKWIWYWADDNMTWNMYAASSGGYQAAEMDSAALERRFQANGKDVVEFRIGSNYYSLNFQDMMQTNRILGTQRPVRRRPSFVPAANVERARKPQEQIGLPPLWDKTMIPSTGYMLVSLLKPSLEYREIEALFHTTMKESTIISIQRVQNKELWEIFQLQKSQMKTKNGGLPPCEMQLFHGTKNEHVSDICLTNVAWWLCHMEGFYGQGSYFARDASSSHCYTDTDSEVRSMFVAQVLVGDFTAGIHGYRQAPSKDGGNVNLYDSCVDDVMDPSTFVVFDTRQIYPAYVLTYRMSAPPANLSQKKVTSPKDGDSCVIA